MSLVDPIKYIIKDLALDETAGEAAKIQAARLYRAKCDRDGAAPAEAGREDARAPASPRGQHLPHRLRKPRLYGNGEAEPG